MMSAKDYLDTLIEGMSISEIPIHQSELLFLKKLIEQGEKKREG